MMEVGCLGKVCGEKVLGSWTLSWAAAIVGELSLLEMYKEGAIILKAIFRAPRLLAELGRISVLCSR